MNESKLYERIYKYRFLLLAISAALTGLTLVLPAVGFLEWIAMIPGFSALLAICGKGKYRLGKTYLCGMLYFGCFYIVNYHWFVTMYPMEFLGVDEGTAAVLVVLCWLGLSAIQTVYSAFVIPAIYYLCKLPAVKKFGVLKPLIIASVFTAFEWGQTLGWWGVPWCRLWLGQIKLLPVLQTASLFGSYFVSFSLVFVNAMAAYALCRAEKKRVCAAAALGAFCLNLTAGVILYYSYSDAGTSVIAAGVQGNISSKDKWKENSYQISTEAYERQTKLAAEDGAKLVVWPETAVPSTFVKDGESETLICRVASECDITLYPGIFTVSPKGKYNTLLEVTPDGKISDTRFSKRHLVPFGEYIPMKGFIEKAVPVITELCNTELVPGESASVFTTEYGNVGALICFDSIYEELALDSVNSGAELLIIGTNDSWFGTSAAVYMHNSQARMRAIETGRYVVRAANTGYSSIISPTGEIIADSPVAEENYVVGDVYFRSEKTLYSRIGNLFVYICIAFCLCLPIYQAAAAIVRRKRISK